MMKKIFFLVNSLEGGGAERVISNISDKLSNDNDVTIITLKNIIFYDLPKNTKYIYLSNIKNNFLMFLLIPFYVFKFKKILKNEKFDNGISFLEISNFVNILANRNAIISFRTNIRFFRGLIGNIYKILIKIFYPKANKIIVNSEENKYDLGDFLGLKEKKIFTIYNPIDEKNITKLKNENIDDFLKSKINGKKVFITVGRLIRSKHYEKIIKSFSKIKYNNWIYLIVGDGQERENLEKISLELGLHDNILFLGTQKNVFKYLNISDFFIYASKVEGFPNVLIESMFCGVPIITSDFKTGAKECILGKYDILLQNIKYPYYGKNGVLIDFDKYEENFFSVYNNLENIKQGKIGTEKFNINYIKIEFEKILFN